jgi:hypothetical protein
MAKIHGQRANRFWATSILKVLIAAGAAASPAVYRGMLSGQSLRARMRRLIGVSQRRRAYFWNFIKFRRGSAKHPVAQEQQRDFAITLSQP